MYIHTITIYLKERKQLTKLKQLRNYIGRTAIDRALFIAEHCTDLQVEALKWAANEIKKSTRDTEKYIGCIKNLNTALQARGQTTVEPDNTWINNSNRENKTNIEQLENELKGAKTSSKENTRVRKMIYIE